MARNEEDSAISLFSFQDIITSLTGIMFLVVLLLVLMLLTSHQPGGRKQAEEVRELQSQIEKLRKELQSHQQTQQMLDESLQKLKQLSAEEIEAMHRQLQEQVRQTRQKLENLTQLNHIVRQENKDIRQKIQTAEETEKTVSKKIESLQKEIARQKELLKKKEQEIKQKKKLIKFAIDSSSSKKPLLAELDADGIAVFNPEANNRIDFKKTGNADAALREFNMYLAGVDKTEYYFSVAVKPSGFKYANSVLKMLKESKIERGFEILPDNQSTLFGETAL